MGQDRRQHDERLASATGLLARFSDELTALVDARLGGDWAENSEILALLALRREPPPTTRLVAELSGLNRRAVSRLVGRLHDDHLVVTRPSLADRRAVVVTLTRTGRSRFQELSDDLQGWFDASRSTAGRIVALLERSSEVDTRSAGAPLMSDPLALLEQIAMVGAELARTTRGRAELAALSGRQRVALVRIASGESTRPGALASSPGASRSTVAYTLDQLDARGLAIRRRGGLDEDRRAVTLEATSSGRLVVESVFEAVDANRAELCRLFTTIRDRRVRAANVTSRPVEAAATP